MCLDAAFQIDSVDVNVCNANQHLKRLTFFFNSASVERVILCVVDGDMGHRADALSCYMKQKHRMIWERRHGPVGSGRKTVLGPAHH